MSRVKLSELEHAVERYCARYHIPPFRISDRYDLHRQWNTDYFPSTTSAGCYSFFCQTEELLYIGKASCGSNIGARAGTYLKWNKETRALDHTGSSGWKTKPAYFFAIPVHEPHQAPSLEEYLIEELDPPENRIKPRRG